MNQPPLILVADDELPAQKLVQRIMEREGFHVQVAGDGRVALDMACQTPFDLILMDVNMPKINGFEVIERLRESEQTARVPVILITAHATAPTDVEHGLGLGADDYIRKPFDPRELAARAWTKIRAYHLEENLKRRTAELEALVRIGEELNAKLDLDTLLEHLLHTVTQEVPADTAILFLYEGDGTTLKKHIPYQAPDKPAQFRRQLPRLLDQLQQLPNEGWQGNYEDNAFADHYGYRSALWVNLYHHGQRIGTLGLLHRQADQYNEDSLRLVRSIVKAAALAIRNAELYDELRDYAENLEAKVQVRTEELQAIQESLIRSEKLASLGRLSAGIAHEFNNPLQAILTCINLAIEDITDGNEVDVEMLEVAEQHVRRISKITRGLLTFARQDNEAYSQIDLNALLTETFILTRKQMQNAKVTLTTDLQTIPVVHAIADRLRQVFVNLTLNAIEAMPKGGELCVGTRTISDFVVIYFEDTGVGISPENQAQLFEPFFSTKGENGTGLGLSLSYGIVEGHGGTIEVESAVGQGATFYVWIPITQEAMPIPEDVQVK